jgi:hypothetical protein
LPQGAAEIFREIFPMPRFAFSPTRLPAVAAAIAAMVFLAGCVMTRPSGPSPTPTGSGSPSMRIDVIGFPHGGNGAIPTNRNTIYQR